MALLFKARTIISISLALFLFLSSLTSSQPQTTNNANFRFTFNDFNDTQTNLTNSGASVLEPSGSGALRLTDNSKSIIGRSFYNTPLNLLNKSSSPPSVSSFRTHFVFSIITPSGGGGFGLAFVVSKSTEFPGSKPEHFLGLFNNTNNGDETNHVFSVEFDTVKGLNDKSDANGNHVGININGAESKASQPTGFSKPGSPSNVDPLSIETGDPIQAWIDYDGVSGLVNGTVSVTIAPTTVEEKPPVPLISHEVNLSGVILEKMFIGFSSSTGENKTSSHYILAWSFSVGSGQAPPLDLSKLPNPPRERNPNPNSSSAFRLSSYKVLIACLAAIILTILLLLFFLTLYKRVMSFERLEDWELDCPHRFKYNDLFKATKGFKDSEVIGVGGFGAVYRGVLPTNGVTVAVKKITRSSDLGMKEFAAEIESLGRLRHKNLVNLQGWCKNKTNLLIVYDYIPYGSLDSLIFKPKNGFVLSWENRFEILKGVASGLLYLHEEWERVVIHRDVKSNNVLIDEDMSAKVGDFGLARLHDHGEVVTRTTGVVGTIGYIAPEIARYGKASTGTDVFAFGALLLEVSTGRRPVRPDGFVLADWVMECYQTGRVFDVVDPNLGDAYAADEVELVLKVGLICSHFRPEARPNMRKVIRYLNWEEDVPVIDHWGLFDSDRVRQLNARFMEGISSDKITSYKSLSVGPFSYSSLDAGR